MRKYLGATAALLTVSISLTATHASPHPHTPATVDTLADATPAISQRLTESDQASDPTPANSGTSRKSEINQAPVSTFASRSERQAAPIIWAIGAGVAAGTAAGTIFFTSRYFNEQEKRELVAECHNTGGEPILDSRDEAGLELSTDGAKAEAASGYTFECQKP